MAGEKFFDQEISLKLRKEELKDIRKILKSKHSMYYSQSHFIRCAIIKLTREEMHELNKVNTRKHIRSI